MTRARTFFFISSKPFSVEFVYRNKFYKIVQKIPMCTYAYRYNVILPPLLTETDKILSYINKYNLVTGHHYHGYISKQ